MAKLADGENVEVKGSSATYTLARHGGVYSCTCPAWQHQSVTIDRRTCKHLRAHLGNDAETARVGAGAPASAARAGKDTADKAPPLLLAHKWETHQDPTGWWMSEKLDGIRAYWDGETFVSRLGNRFWAPDWFVAELPADTLDGELWVGRKKFQSTTSIVRSGAASREWEAVTYVVFDAPNAAGGFEARLAHLEKVFGANRLPYARAHAHVRCEGVDHLRAELARVEALGGEGLMLRAPGSAYVVGRSTTLLKVKTFHDAEARVIGHAPGTGRHKGRLGALVVELPDGVRFNVGTGFSDAERERPPAIGSVITFRCQELSNDGVPRFPSYVGERIDVALPSKSKPTTQAAKPAAAAARPAKPKPAPRAKPKDDAPAAGGDFHVRLVHETDGKFWEIEVRGTKHYMRFGKVGQQGQTRVADLGTPAAARADAEQRAHDKRKHGFA